MAQPRITDYEDNTKCCLLYARLLLELLELKLLDKKTEPVYRPALLSAATAQLNFAYEAFIEEIQVRLNMAPLATHNPNEIARHLLTADIRSAELNQLAKLEQEETSWLFAMRTARPDRSARPALSHNNIKKTPRTADIRLIGRSGDRTPQPQESPCVWLQHMEDLCQQMREMATEY